MALDEKDIEKNIKSLRDQLKKLGKDGSADDLKDIQDEIKKTRGQIDELSKSGKNVDQLNRELNSIDETVSKSFSRINKTVKESESIFDQAFASIKQGLNTDTGNLIDKAEEFINLFDITSPGANLEFWRAYDKRIRDVGVSYGLTSNRVEEFRVGSRKLEQQFIDLGGSSEDLYKGIEALYNQTNRTDLITKDFVDTLGGMTLAFGINATEAGKYIGSFRDLNITYAATGKIMNDLRNAAVSAGLNTSKIFSVFTEKFKDLNTYSFKNGVQGMVELVKQSQALKINMDSVLSLSNDFTDPEKTMEFASNMQMLGGSFAQLGDFNKLMYDAAVAPEELAKNIAKASASMGSFNRETGRLDISFAERMQLDRAGKELGMTRKEMMDMASAAGKINDMKVSLNFKPLSEDAYNTLSTLSEFDLSKGEYVVKFKDEKGEEVTKSIAELSEEDIKKIAETKETESLKSLKTERFDAVQLQVQKFEGLKLDAPDFFKAIGGQSEELKKSLDGFNDSISKGLGKMKENAFMPVENFLGKLASEQLSAGLKNMTSALDTFIDLITKAVEEAKKTGIYKETKAAVKEAVQPSTSQTPAPEIGSMGAILYGDKFSEGNILKGLSHDEGGIPFTINGKPGFEAEGGEVLLTKGVSKDPDLLSAASDINEAAGGKKLFDDGGIVQKYADGGKIPSISNYDYKNVSQIFENISNTTQLQKTINNETYEKLTNTFVPLYENFNDYFKNVDQTNTKLIDVLNKLNENLINQKNIDVVSGREKGNVLTMGGQDKTIYEKIRESMPKEIEDFRLRKSNFESENKKSEITNVGKKENSEWFNKTLEQYKKNENEYKVSDLITGIGDLSINNKNYSSLQKLPTLESNEIDKNKNLNIESLSVQKLTSNDLNKSSSSNISNISNYDNAMSLTTQKIKEMVSYIEGSKSINNVSNKIESPTFISNLKTNDQLSDLVSPLKGMDKFQGGLVEKRSEIGLNSMSVGGTVNVGGNVSFTPIKVTIEGTSASKEINVPDNVQKEILRVVEDKIKNMNLYSQFLTKKNTGIPDGKGVEFPGMFPA
jgi:hypothetical protein